MQNQFTEEPTWTAEQKIVFKSEPNIIVSGCAGSGKTLLACHIALLHEKENKIVILVYTKALRTYITDYLNKFGNNNIDVLYEFQWRKRDFPRYDIIIVDEFQDFSSNDISNFIKHSNKGVFLFGDIEQKIYNKNYYKEPTLKFETILEQTKFPHIKLMDNFRISEENKKIISCLYKNKGLNNSKQSTGTIPEIMHFENVMDELNYIKDFLLNNKEFKNIGILLERNDERKISYIQDNVYKKDILPGIIELNKFLESNGIKNSYKHEFDDYLDFSNETNINIMTYHSSKGLQFDCIILPFSNYACIDFPTHYYVALTRATKKIIITYTGLVADIYANSFLHKSTFKGQIIKRSEQEKFQEMMRFQALHFQKDKQEWMDTEYEFKS